MKILIKSELFYNKIVDYRNGVKTHYLEIENTKFKSNSIVLKIGDREVAVNAKELNRFNKSMCRYC